VDKIMSFLESNKENYLDLLKQLVNIDCGTSNIEGVNKVSKILEEKFRELDGNINVEVIPNEKCGSHLIITRKGNIDGKILILGHMDTVFPEGTVSERPFTIKNDKAFGPGTDDMKAGIVSTYFALKAVNQFYGENTKTI